MLAVDEREQRAVRPKAAGLTAAATPILSAAAGPAKLTDRPSKRAAKRANPPSPCGERGGVRGLRRY
jgi:hypothetical protein